MSDVMKSESAFASVGRYEIGGDAASICVKTWAPTDASSDRPPVAVLQLNHGMVEYIDRYDAFARAVAAQGWLVVGMDFLGHGDSVVNAGQLGHTGVALPNGRNALIEDMHALRQRTQTQWPDVPYIMFGHSMGSFVLRAYLAEHGDGLAGAVISGTGTMSGGMVHLAKALLWGIGLFHKPDYRSKFFEAMSIGPYNKPFEKGGRTEFDWLSRDNEQVDKYVADPRCGGVFTLAADRLLIDSIALANAPTAYEHTPKQLPLLLISGGSDPVGGMKSGVTKVADAYRHAGVQDVTLKLYDDARH
ncbi:MAG: lysophospholipase, partial [Propionibacteriaceae bacterium]|nr:lysophospholipase [Propionibacteriaceae bacterium]